MRGTRRTPAAVVGEAVEIVAFNGARRVVASGTVILAASESSMAITLGDAVIGFRFHEPGGEMNAAPTQVGPNTVWHDLFNVAQPGGATYVMPAALRIDGVDLTVALFVQSVGVPPHTTRAVLYSVHHSS